MAESRIIPTAPRMGRGLINHDPRSRDYPVELTGAARRTRTWRRGLAYDQGQTSECVAYTGKGMLNTATLSANVAYQTRRNYNPDVFYAGAQAADEWPGEAYDGTSGLGLCRYLQQTGLIASYRWCFTLDDILDTLSQTGPVGVGIEWLEDMFHPDDNGLVHATGAVAGGHQFELIGVDVEHKTVTAANSWGLDWGDHGRFRLTWDDLGLLLAANGDAFTLLAAA